MAAQLYSLPTAEMQGYFFARPLSVEDCTKALIERRRLESVQILERFGAPGLLLVDDSEEDLALLKMTLSHDGYRIITATTPQQGFDALTQEPFQIVITDQNMPGMSGIEFLSRVRALYPKVVRIMTSGDNDIGTVTDAVNEAGIQKYFSKDWDDVRIRAAVREAQQRQMEE